jgi:hypothetical protein
MAPTPRSTPTGTALEDGYSTKIAFAADPDVGFWEKTVTPPGIDGGDAIEQTTMHNSTWRTFAARSLATLTDVSVTAAYDPAVYPQIVALINVEGLITLHFPDGSTLDFYGFLKEFTPGEHSEGDQPEADITIICTNRNPTSGAEVGPVFTD